MVTGTRLSIRINSETAEVPGIAPSEADSRRAAQAHSKAFLMAILDQPRFAKISFIRRATAYLSPGSFMNMVKSSPCGLLHSSAIRGRPRRKERSNTGRFEKTSALPDHTVVLQGGANRSECA